MVEAMLKFSNTWSSDTFLRDTFPGNDHSYSFDISRADESTKRKARYEKFPNYLESPNHSVSGSSSEGSDWVNFEEDISSILPVTDGSVSMLLDDGLVDSIGVGDLNWAELESFTNETISNDILESTGVSHASRKKGKRKRSPDHLSSAQWSRMSCEEQLETVEALTRIISQNMTLREQIEIISIIDPSAVISPSDTEFAIDLEFLNDSKLQNIKDIIKEHTIMSSSSRGFSDVPSSVMHKCSSSSHHLTSKVKSRKKQVDEQRPYLEEIELRQRKLLRQSKKEKRSGLFLYEKKIKRLRNSPKEEEEDVNILD